MFDHIDWNVCRCCSQSPNNIQLSVQMKFLQLIWFKTEM